MKSKKGTPLVIFLIIIYLAAFETLLCFTFTVSETLYFDY